MLLTRVLHFCYALAVTSAFSVIRLPTAQAGPWTRSPGSFYVKVGEGLFRGDGYKDAAGAWHDNVDYTGATTFAYFEAGLLEGLHVQGYLPFTLAQNDFSDGGRSRHRGGGDALVGLQLSPTDLGFPTALRLEAKVPLYDGDGSSGIQDPLRPALGDGQLDFTLWASAGAGVSNIPVYFYGEVGYQHRTELGVDDSSRRYSDGIAMAVRAGYSPHEQISIGAGSTGVIPFQADAYSKAYVTVGPSLYVKIIEGLAVELSWDPVVYAKNSSAGYGASLGLSYSQ